MRLLVSVTSAEEASAALAGGADIIDAKNPLAGALGAVPVEVLREIHAMVAGARLVTAAIGDATDETAIERAAWTFAAAGAALVKVGFAGITSASRIEALIGAAVRGVSASDGTWGPATRPVGSGFSRIGPPDQPAPRLRRSAEALAEAEGGPHVRFRGVVAVAYADADRVASLEACAFVDVAARAGAIGLLLDTADKSGPGLRELMTATALAHWVAQAHEAGLLVALAGKLTADDLAFVRDAGADIAGVRGAACDGGRTGRVSSERVALLRTLCNPPRAVCNPPKGGSHVRDLSDGHDLADVRGIRL
jgi:(5-formylfuran-3-yl)methyl phosphate synthase